jgi:hypothetical protein
MLRDLGWLLHPVARDTFFADHHERAILHVRGRRRDRYSRLFSVRTLEKLLWLREAELPRILGVVREGERLSPPRGARSLRNWALDEQRRGATLVVDDLGAASLAITRLEGRLLPELGGMTTSAYWSPPRARGLHAHFDNHDVMVLQVAGSKTWSTYGEGLVKLPLSTQQRPIDDATLRRRPRTFALRAGDLLYLPRGVIHRAISGDETSLHLTMAAMPTLWVDVLIEVLQIAAERDVALRRAAPLLEARRAVDPTPGRALYTLLESIDKRAVEVAWSQLRHRLFANVRRLPGRDDRTLRADAPLAVRDLVQRRPDIPSHVGPVGDGVGISVPGLSAGGLAAISGPAWLEPAMRFIVSSDGAFAIGALPGRISDETKLALVGRLVREGFLRRLP